MNAAGNAPQRVQIAVAVVRHAGRYLIGLRPEGAPLAGCWEFPGGKLQPNEDARSAAVRECLEETGLEVRVVGEFPPVTHRYEHGALELRFFDCELLSQDTSALPARFRWVTVSELSQYRFPPANDALLRALQSDLC